MTKEIHDINTKALDRPQEWIPCGERMPEYRKTVLISTFWGVKTGFLDSTEAYGDFWEIIEDDATAALHSIYAWMPLPKPYKADRKTEPQTYCPNLVCLTLVQCKNCKYNPDKPHKYYDDDLTYSYAWCWAFIQDLNGKGYCPYGKEIEDEQ